MPEPILLHIAAFVGRREAGELMVGCRRALELVGLFFLQRLNQEVEGLGAQLAALNREYADVIRVRAGATPDEIARDLARSAEIRTQAGALAPRIREARNDRFDLHERLQAGHARPLPAMPESDEET